VGEAGLLVDAADVDALSEALGRLLTDGALQGRLIRAGFDQARHFTWEGAAQQLLHVYRSF
jgi:glycosyltransferase involved in cell wall biosynthesis